MVSKLQEDPRRRFLWAEVSFFAKWWGNISAQKRAAVRRPVPVGSVGGLSSGPRRGVQVAVLQGLWVPQYQGEVRGGVAGLRSDGGGTKKEKAGTGVRVTCVRRNRSSVGTSQEGAWRRPEVSRATTAQRSGWREIRVRDCSLGPGIGCASGQCAQVLASSGWHDWAKGPHPS